MKYRLLLIAAIISFTGFFGNAQTTRKTAHQKQHQELLANQKNRIDKNVISDFVSNDIIGREDNPYADLSAESASMLNDILKESNKHLGKRYRGGSKGPNAFDCSGFTSYVYKQFGINLSSHSRAQYANDGVKVDRKHLRKGDLVFFTSRSSHGAVGHVGIVTEANNETGDFHFIHASISGVKVSRCEGYYEGRYIGAKRVITE